MGSPASVVVIGAGQSGLATGYHLKRRGLDFLIVADDERVGDPWRARWDSLRLFTPAFYNGLPGMEFPAPDPDHLPRKGEVADYLEAYADRFDLPLRLGTRVTGVDRTDGRFHLETSAGPMDADAVVVATGAHSNPRVPEFAGRLSQDIRTRHSSEYRAPAQIGSGDVLVVGAGNSGTQIAAELADADTSRTVYLSGPDTGTLPRRLLGRDIYRWLRPTLMRLQRTSFLGRLLHRKTASKGDPVFDVERAKAEEAGVERVTRIVSVEEGLPVSREGRRFDVEEIVWATGFRPDFSWIELDAFDPEGRPCQVRGVATEVRGLYFVGLRWLHRLDSSLLGGVGADARHVADHIHRTFA